MKETNWGWVSRQLGESDSTQEVKDALVFTLKALREQDIDDHSEIQVLNLLTALLQGHSIAASKPRERWGPVIPGAYNVGDTVRVRLDAYDGEKGTKHNGKRGRVTASRNGLVRVLLNDAPNSDVQTYYAPEKLERLR